MSACDRCAGPPATHVVRGAINRVDGRGWMTLESHVCAGCAAHLATENRARAWLLSLYEHRMYALGGAALDVFGVAGLEP